MTVNAAPVKSAVIIILCVLLVNDMRSVTVLPFMSVVVSLRRRSGANGSRTQVAARLVEIKAVSSGQQEDR